MQIEKIIGQNLKKIRIQRGLTLQEVASSLAKPISFQQLRKYETGVNRISVALLIECAKILKCSIIELLEGITNLQQELSFYFTKNQEVEAAILNLIDVILTKK